jgi:hypothetical protein
VLRDPYHGKHPEKAAGQLQSFFDQLQRAHA